MDPATPTHSSPPAADPGGDLAAGRAAGVPYVALPPRDPTRRDTPLVLAWHLLDPPRTEAAFAAALPLRGLDAWRVYLGLPLCGQRLPAGGFEELGRLAATDPVLSLYQPIVEGAAGELPAALEVLTDRLGLAVPRVGLVGGSIGAAVAALVMAEGSLRVDAAALVSPVVRLRSTIDLMSRLHGAPYAWTPRSRAVAERLDFRARAVEIAGRGAPAVRCIVGEHDAPEVHEQATGLVEALRRQGAPSAEVTRVDGMAHALAQEPGTEPAPQSRDAVRVDGLAVEWLSTHLAA